MYTAVVFAFAFALLFPAATCNKNVQVGVNHLDGDQTVGGIHFFELHAPNGGTGLGFKVLLIAAIALFIIYWFIKRRARDFMRSYFGSTPARSARQHHVPLPLSALQLQQLQALNQIAPVHQQPRRSYRVGPLEDEEEEA